jgi:hypothetical protein
MRLILLTLFHLGQNDAPELCKAAPAASLLPNHRFPPAKIAGHIHNIS